MSKNYGNNDSKKLIPALIWISIGVGLIGGTTAVVNLWLDVIKVFFCFFPIIGAKAVENYLTSPYFIVSIIMLIGSGFGIYFGHKGGKILYLVVSLIVAALNLASMGINLF